MKERLKISHGQDLIEGIMTLIKESFVLKTAKSKKKMRRRRKK